MEQRASGLSGLAYCRRAGINSKTFYYWQNVIQKELLASKAQYADVVETLSPSSEPLKPSKVEHETSAPKTPATSVEVAHETVEPSAESTPALPEPPESTSQEEVHFVSLKCIRPSSQPAQSPQPALEISCGTTCITVTEDTLPKLLRQTLCILRDVFSSCWSENSRRSTSIWPVAIRICGSPSTGLPPWLSRGFIWTRTSRRFSCFAVVARTASRVCSGMRQASCCSTSASKMASINGRMSQRTCWRSRSSSSAGSRKGLPSRRPN